MRVIRSLGTEIKRAIFTPQFPMVILAMIGCSYFHTHTGFTMFTASDYYIFMIESYGQMTFTICCIILTALSVCDDLENKYLRYQIIREGRNVYVLSKMIVGFCVNYLAIVLSSVIYIGFVMLRYPWSEDPVQNAVIPMLGESAWILRILVSSVLLNLSVSIYCEIAMLLAAFVTNRMFCMVVPACIKLILTGISFVPTYYFDPSLYSMNGLADVLPVDIIIFLLFSCIIFGGLVFRLGRRC